MPSRTTRAARVRRRRPPIRSRRCSAARGNGGSQNAPGVAEIAGLAHLAVQFELLAVTQRGQRLSRLDVEGHLRARVAVELQDEALALAGDRRGFHDAAFDDHDLAPGGFDRGRRAWQMEARVESAGEEECEQAAGSGERLRAAPPGEKSEEKKGCDGRENFGLAERYKPEDQDARSDSSQGTQEGILQLLKSDCSRRHRLSPFSRPIAGRVWMPAAPENTWRAGQQ